MFFKIGNTLSNTFSMNVLVDKHLTTSKKVNNAKLRDNYRVTFLYSKCPINFKNLLGVFKTFTRRVKNILTIDEVTSQTENLM